MDCSFDFVLGRYLEIPVQVSNFSGKVQDQTKKQKQLFLFSVFNMKKQQLKLALD